MNDDRKKLYDVTQEIRIASVMFGGVSLAVYMNGITQELLRLVRATTDRRRFPNQQNWGETGEEWKARRNSGPLLADEELKSTEKIYRLLGRSLFHGRIAGTDLTNNGPIRTRVVVDLLAGTSAGGINSVYLAKALVNNQSLDTLNEMWMGQADIDTLLNDVGSDPSSYPSGREKTSLLNSVRMYGLLHHAFEEMEKETPGAPLADELDLFVTTTDLDGVATPIQLADRMIEERVHKASFHFAFGPGRPGSPNDFTKIYNPMLAFAARCTSSFPIAFEPMKLRDVDRLIPALSGNIFQHPDHPLRKFFSQFEINHPGLSFVKRPLADGGYLNNKPFSFVIDEVKLRTSTVPTRRKLLFLDPFPELNSKVRHTQQEITFAQNALDAAIVLPRYQTIREDIERLNDYNRDLHFAHLLSQEIEGQTAGRMGTTMTDARQRYDSRTISELEQEFGVCYGAYHSIRLSSVTMELASLVTQLMGLNHRSDDVVAVNMLIRSWRRASYAPNGEGGRKLETLFLSQFDIGFRVRRTEYVKNRIDALLAALGSRDEKTTAGLLQSIFLRESIPTAAHRLDEDSPVVTEELLRLRDEIEHFKWRLVSDRQRLQGAVPDSGAEHNMARQRAELQGALASTEITRDDLGWILTPVDDSDCQIRADHLYSTGVRPNTSRDGGRLAYSDQPTQQGAAEPRPIQEGIEKAAGILTDSYAEMLGTLARDFTRQIHRVQNVGSSALGIVNEYVWFHYQYFDLHDMLVFTASRDERGGEGSPVEIYRISPLDALLLHTSSDPQGADKLVGTELFAFGAFLSKSGRANDMMWGRLDGAERIIWALLPDEEDGALRMSLCEQAFEIILKDEFKPSDCADLIRPLMDYLKQSIGTVGKSADQFLQAAIRESEANCRTVVTQLLKSIASDSDRRAVFEHYYVKPAAPPVEVSLKRLRRAIAIFRDMLKMLNGDAGPFVTLTGSLANLGVALVRFAEFCIPQSLVNAIFKYTLSLLFMIGFLLVGVGAFIYKDVETAGWIVLIIAAILQILAWVILKWLFRQRTGRKIGSLAALIALCFAVFFVALIRFPCERQCGAWKAPIYVTARLDRSGRLSVKDFGCGTP